MIDIENDVFTAVATTLRTQYSGIYVAGDNIAVPASFPAVTIVESDNRIYERMRTTTIENAAEVMYTINVYSNKASGKKAEAKAIAATIDSIMELGGFTRTLKEQIPNERDSSIYRLVMRYEGIVGPGATAGTYLVYQNNT